MSKIVNQQHVGSIHWRKDGQIHLYLMDDPREDVTLEIVIAKEATNAFLKEVLSICNERCYRLANGLPDGLF